ncbi:MAG TPA: 2-isopropylmalate synthase, partial [Nitrospirae bacterium]|nr:2-isopropylmalate synthase [Nitrospirota bacterium]
ALPISIGLKKTKFVLGKLSGRHAFKIRLNELGYSLSDEEINNGFERFKKLADQKKEIYDEDIEALVSEEVARIPEKFSLIDLNITAGINLKPSASIKLKVDEELIEKTEYGDGPVDAAYKAIASIADTSSNLVKFEVKSITGGTDALGEVIVSLEEDGRFVRGHGADTDIIVASVRAYINALNKLAARRD